MSSPWAKLTEDEQKNISVVEDEYNKMPPVERQKLLNELRAAKSAGQQPASWPGISHSDKSILAAKLAHDVPVRGVTLMATIVGNQGSSSNEAFSAIKVLSDARGGAAVNKERTPIPATFGPGGHGKTHLCRSLVSELPNYLRSECKVAHPICFHISFNQTSAWNSHEIPVAAVWGRCMQSLGLSGDFCSPPMTFAQVLNSVREAVVQARGCNFKDVGVCFLLDEIMKVPVNPRRTLLNELTSAMQCDLADDLPTFMLVTSLEVDPVYEVIQTQSRRPLAPILLHVLSDADKREIVDDVYALMCFCLSGGVSEAKYNEAHGKKFVYRFLEYNVFHATPHYRSIEEIIINVLRHFVPANFDSNLKKRKNGGDYQEVLNHPEFPKSSTLQSIEKVVEAWCTETTRIDVMAVPTAQLVEEERQCLIGIFAQHVLGLEVWTTESACKSLLDKDVLVVRKRSTENIFRICVVPSLPYLLQLSKQYHSISEPMMFSTDCIWASLRALEGVLLTSLRDAADRFEDLVPILMLLRASALLLLNPTWTDVPINSLLPGALMNFEGPLYLRLPTQPCALIIKSSVTGANAIEAARAVIAEAHASQALFVMEGARELDQVEGAGGHFSIKSESKEESVTLAITAKLRIPGKDTPRGANLAKNAQEKLNLPGIGLLAVSCYVEDDSIPLPKRSIVLGIREVQSLLMPFGVSFMLSIVEKKANDKKAYDKSHDTKV